MTAIITFDVSLYFASISTQHVINTIYFYLISFLNNEYYVQKLRQLYRKFNKRTII